MGASRYYRHSLPFMVRAYSRKFDVPIEVKGSQAYSTATSVVIPELSLRDEVMTRMTYGFLAHEAGHVHYSDFERCRELNNTVLQHLVNCLEDGRIENLISHSTIGVYENLAMLNQCLLHDNRALIAQDFAAHWSKLDILFTVLIFISHERLNKYPGIGTIKQELLNDLSCLMNEGALQEIIALTWQLPACADTADIINLAVQIVAILQRPNSFVPNFSRFALRYQLTSQFDLENCRRLAQIHGQDFVAPVLCPMPALKGQVTLDKLLPEMGLNISVSTLLTEYYPDFLAPRAPSFMSKSNSAALLERYGLDVLYHAARLSAKSAGNEHEVKRLYAPILRKHSAQALGQALQELVPLLGSSKEAKELKAELIARGKQPTELITSLPMPGELSALSHALSFNPETYTLKLSWLKEPATSFFGVSPNPSPYQGAYQSRVEWLTALQNEQKSTALPEESLLPPDLAALDEQWAQLSGGQERYWRLKQRDLSVLAQQHLTCAEVSQLGLQRVTPSLELCTRLIYDAWANPTIEQPLLPWLDLRDLPQSFKEKMQRICADQDKRIATIKALRRPLAGLLKPELCAHHTHNAAILCSDFFAKVQGSTSLSATIAQGNALRTQCSWPVIQYVQDASELSLLDWGNDPKSPRAMPQDLLSANAFDKEVWEVAASVSSCFKQDLLRQRAALKFQRTEAILQEQHLLNPKSLDPNPSLNPAVYCGHDEEALVLPLLQRTLVARRTILHNCPTPIAPVVHPSHYQALLSAQDKFGSKLPPHKQDKPQDLSTLLEQHFKTPQLKRWEDAPLAFNSGALGAAQAALGDAHTAPTQLEVLQSLLEALPELPEITKQDNFFTKLKQDIAYHHTTNLRDPRLECTFNDALREYWYVRSPQNLEAVPLPITDPRTIINRIAKEQGLGNKGHESWQVNPHAQNDPSMAPSYYQLDLKQFVADVRRKYDPLRRQLRRRLQSYLEVKQEVGLRGRRIDVRRAVKIPLGESHIFKQRTRYHDENTLLHLLVDCSGSMAQSAMTQGTLHLEGQLEDTRIYQACAAALTLGLALERLPGISLMITFFPHNLDDQPYFNVIAPGERVSAHPERLWHPPCGSTPMAQALNYAAERVMSYHPTRGIIVIITDGQPNNPEALKQEIVMAKESGLELYGIGINESKGHEYFEHFYNLTDFSDLTKELCTLVSKVFTIFEVA